MASNHLIRNRNPSRRESSAYSGRSRPPWRIVPLALGAVALTCASAAAAVEVFRDLSGDRYAVEIIADEIDKLS